MTLLDHLRKTLPDADIAPGILGQEEIKHDLKSALLVGRNVILVGPPGIGKTTLAKELLDILPKKDGQEPPFVRVQGSPDLTAEDLLGDIDPMKALEFGPMSEEAFTPGKIFKADGGILFFDEVNRAPQKLQNALLQVLEEKSATVGSFTVDFPTNFILIATMNPQDDSTEELSHVFLDRFDLLYVTYPESAAIESKIVAARGKKVKGVTISKDQINYIVKFIRKTRARDDILKAPSVRATLGLYERAQANALLAGKVAVDHDDITKAIHSVLSHRIELKPSVKYLKSPGEVLQEIQDQMQSEVGASNEADSP